MTLESLPLRLERPDTTLQLDRIQSASRAAELLGSGVCGRKPFVSGEEQLNVFLECVQR